MTRPNILFLLSDEHHAGFTGYEGHPQVKTPTLDRLAQEGTRFRRAYCQDGICLPSRASMFSGQYCRSIGFLSNTDWEATEHHTNTVTPLPEVLRQGGYKTGGFGKRHLPHGMDYGFEETATNCNQKMDPSDTSYHEWLESIGEQERVRQCENEWVPLHAKVWDIPQEVSRSHWITDLTIDFIQRSKQEDKPFFACCSYLKPHGPYFPVKRFYDMYKDIDPILPDSVNEDPSNLPPLLRMWRSDNINLYGAGHAKENPELYKHFTRCYMGCISEIDWQMGRILDLLEAEGLADNTIVIYSSDHGDFACGHGLVEKCALGHNVYEDTLRVPLIVKWPEHIQSEHCSQDLAELVDIYPTLLDAAEQENKPEYRLAGRSLLPHLTEGKPLDRTVAFSENWSQVTVIGKRYKLGTWLKTDRSEGDFREFGDMLFDLENDPLEMNNLYGKPGTEAIEAELRAELQNRLDEIPSDGYNELYQGSMRGWLEDLELGKFNDERFNQFL